MKVNIFKYSSYREYLLAMFNCDELGKGQRSALAKHLNCQTGFISQVINGARHFSIEHLLEVAGFYGLEKDETDFLILLGHYERAGTAALKEYCKEQLDDLRFSRQRIPVNKNRDITDYDFAIYNSQWYYVAVHVLMEKRPAPTPEQISRILRINIAKVNKAISFLQEINAVVEEGGTFKSQLFNNSLGRNSPHVDTVHRHLRLEAIKSLENRVPEDSHYSRFFLASKDRAAILQEELYEFLRKFNESIGMDYKNQDEEMDLFGLSTDIFKYTEL